MKRASIVAALVALTSILHAQPPAPPPLPLVHQADLVYQGAFRVPGKQSGDTDDMSFAYGGELLTFNPLRGTLFMKGRDIINRVGEFTIAEIRSGPVSALARAFYVQKVSDPTEGKIKLLNPADPNDKRIGGLLPFGNKLAATGYSSYDNTQPPTKPSHYLVNPNWSVLGDVVGPFVVGTLGGGKVGGYMADIPPEWQAALGGKALSGQCCVAVASRTNLGPGISVFDPADIGVKNPVPAIELLGYPIDHPIGNYNSANQLYNGTAKMGGVVFPRGTRSVLFFYRIGSTFCYGPGTTNQALVGTIGIGQKDPYCYDLEDQNKGTHGWPYRDFVAAFDANDLVKVKTGQLKPWEPRPYATWTLTFPNPAPATRIMGAAYDPATNRIFLSQFKADGSMPLIQVFTVGVNTTPTNTQP